MIVRCAHGDHVGIIGGGVERTVRTVVAGRHHDDDALQPGILDGGIDRAGLVALLDCGLQREVHDPDVERVLVEDSPENGVHDRRRRRGAGPIIDPKVDQVCLGGDADVATCARRPITRDDPRHCGAMAIGVVGTGDRGIEIAVHDHPTAEVRVCTDPTVDHGDADPRAGQRSDPVAPGGDGIDDSRVGRGKRGRIERRVGQLDRGVVDDPLDIRPGTEARDERGAELGGDPMPDRHSDRVLDAGPPQVSFEGIELAVGDQNDGHPPALLHRLEDLAVEVCSIGGRPGGNGGHGGQRQAGGSDHESQPAAQR